MYLPLVVQFYNSDSNNHVVFNHDSNYRTIVNRQQHYKLCDYTYVSLNIPVSTLDEGNQSLRDKCPSLSVAIYH